jgi:type IV secretory pathway VirB4 component
MPFYLGTHYFNPAKKVFWDYKKENNPHLMLIGQSGSGKTYLLRKILKHLDKRGIKTFVIDFHGDLHIENDQTFEFTTINPEYGIGVFEFDTDPKSGGIYNRIEELIKIFENSFFNSMSPLRKAALKKLFTDVYMQKGYDPNNPQTWNKPIENLPTLEDVLNLIDNIKEYLSQIKNNYILNSPALLKMNELLKSSIEIDNKNELVAKAEVLFDEYIKELKNISPNEINHIKAIEKKLGIRDFDFYTKKNMLGAIEGIEVYIKAMVDSKIFSKHNPVPDRNKNIYRFNLQYLNDEIMLFVANLIIQRIFTKLRKSYNPNKPSSLKVYILIDESKLVIPNKSKNDDFHYINRIVSEARKFGLGVILASQRTAHYSEEMLANIATKIMLKVADNEKPVAKKKLGIDDKKIFDQIASKEYGICYFKSSRENCVVKQF